MDAARQAELLADAGRYLAGGGTGLFILPPELNLVVARGKGSRVWDVAGREYLDYHLGSGPVLLGHANEAVTEAVQAQLGKGTTYFFLNEPEIRLAKRLVEAIPCADVVHYTGSGTEATYYALRIARAWTREARDRMPNALRRAGQPNEIVTAALYLASPASSFTTGTLVRVDGGMV